MMCLWIYLIMFSTCEVKCPYVLWFISEFIKGPVGLSGGAIAGITCACLIVAVAGAAAGYYFYRKRYVTPTQIYL